MSVPVILTAALCLLAGCSAALDLAAATATPAVPDASPAGRGGGVNVTQLAGALLLHEFPAGGHGTITVLEQPISVAELDGREPFSLPYATTVRQGQCRLYLQPHCTPACPGTSLCSAPQVCTVLPSQNNVDMGEVQVTGSLTAPLIRLWFIAPQDGYGVDPEPGAAQLFAGGERLTVSGGRGPYALQGSWPAPIPVVIYEPPAPQPLHLPVAGPLAFRWEPASAAQMTLVLHASQPNGEWGYIRCLVPDSGSFTVPAALLAALPPPPRSVRYELERDEEILVPLDLAPGVGMLVHAAFTAWQNGNDP